MILLTDYLKTEQDVIKSFINSDLNQLPYSVEPNVKWRNGNCIYEFDAVIKYKNIPLAVVEIKQSLHHQHVSELEKRQVNKAVSLLNCYYGIITDGTEFYLCDNNKEYHKCDFDHIKKTLLTRQFSHGTISKSFLNNIKIILAKEGLESFVEKYEENNGHYCLPDNDELDFWGKLLNLNGGTPSVIYRYTTLETAFQILNKGTYRMYGIVGMNDSSEVYYFDKYCYSKNIKPNYQILNNLFLSSCSLLKDNLTMWRLYGENAKGVCLVFKKIRYSKRVSITNR